jgi:N-methylhydantoinase A
LDNMGLIQVGPKSAGSVPGPACYDLGGTQPTVTDADLVLGYLDSGNFLGGDMALSNSVAEEAINNTIAEPLSISVIEAAWAIHEIVTENMAQASVIHALEKGRKVENFCVVPIGGAGPVHACSLATKMGIKRMISPPSAGVASAIGMLASPSVFGFMQADIQQLEGLNFLSAQTIFKTLTDRGRKLLEMSNLNEREMTFENSALMRYTGQGYEVEVPLEISTIQNEDRNDIKERFETVYMELFGRVESMPLEIISWRVVVSGPTPEFSLASSGDNRVVKEALKGSRPVYFGENGYTDTDVYDRSLLKPDFRVAGPAIIEERESTLVVPPEFTIELHTSGNLLLDRK